MMTKHVRTLAAAAVALAALTASSCSDGDESAETSTTASSTTDSTTTTTTTSTLPPVAPGTLRCGEIVVELDLSPGISAVPADQAVTMTGSLSSCTGGDPGAPESGELALSGTAQDVVAAPGTPGEVMLEVAGELRWSDGTVSSASAQVIALDGSDGRPIGITLAVTGDGFTGSTPTNVPLDVGEVVPGASEGSMVRQTFEGGPVELVS
jgi:hypothetical protein